MIWALQPGGNSRNQMGNINNILLFFSVYLDYRGIDKTSKKFWELWGGFIDQGIGM